MWAYTRPGVVFSVWVKLCLSLSPRFSFPQSSSFLVLSFSRSQFTSLPPCSISNHHTHWPPSLFLLSLVTIFFPPSSPSSPSNCTTSPHHLQRLLLHLFLVFSSNKITHWTPSLIVPSPPPLPAAMPSSPPLVYTVDPISFPYKLPLLPFLSPHFNVTPLDSEPASTFDFSFIIFGQHLPHYHYPSADALIPTVILSFD